MIGLWFNVYLGDKLIDEVFYTFGMTEQEVYHSLVNHDGYDPQITVEEQRIDINPDDIVS